MTKSFDKKLEQLQLQHTIYNILHKDNGVSSHFDYHVNIMSDDETIRLNLLTYNEKHKEYMLFHTVLGTSSIDCLTKMLNYIKSKSSKIENSYTIKWTKSGDNTPHQSYFTGKNEEEAVLKFLHEKNKEDYTYNVVLNPVS
jgi:Lhr-like helicase